MLHLMYVAKQNVLCRQDVVGTKFLGLDDHCFIFIDSLCGVKCEKPQAGVPSLAAAFSVHLSSAYSVVVNSCTCSFP